MTVRAVIIDIYGTLLRIERGPEDAPARWNELWRRMLGADARMTLPEFGAACDRAIALEHAVARAAGIPFPEIFWPDIVLRVLPEFASRSMAERDEFLYEQAGLWHTVSLMPGAAKVLRGLGGHGCLLGVASNAQPYTVHEVAGALATAQLSPEIFAPDLSFWSFAHGFGKPDPHVFRLLAARLAVRGVSAAETCMVGDRIDNDIAPARAQGWRTWHFSAHRTGADGGDWAAFGRFLSGDPNRAGTRETARAKDA